MDPNFGALLAKAWQGKAALLAGLQAHPEAKMAFQQALAYNQKEVDNWTGLGFVELELDNVQGAAFCFERALTIDGTSEVAVRGLTIHSLRLGHFERALQLTSTL